MMGSKLTSLHLLKSDKLNNASTTYIGSPNPTIGRTGWSGGTIWINAKKVVAHQGYRATKRGSCGLTNVSESVWDFHVGSYQVCHKWLKDRQGQALCEKDIAHYLKIICAINHTIPIMSTIESTIEEHGGWPHAFYTRQESKHSNPHSNHPH